MYLIVGNWKMNPKSLTLALKTYKEISKKLNSQVLKKQKVQVSLCVPSLYLSDISKIKKEHVALGIEDAHFLPTGAETGLSSIEMVSSYKPKFGLVGHSEVRSRGETDTDVNQKVLEYLRKNIKPIICVGENERDHNGLYLRHIREQLQNALLGVPKKSLASINIAYEPIWAIGDGAVREATSAECLEVSIYIRRVLTDLFGVEFANKIKILYGGSVNNIDAMEFIEHGGADGLLVGRASLSVKDFSSIISQVIDYAKHKKGKNK